MTMRPLLFICPALLLLSFSSLLGQIVYTQIDPPQIVSSGEGIKIDFNEDLRTDLLLMIDSYKVGAGCDGTQMGDLFFMKPADTAYVYYDTSDVFYVFNYLDTIEESKECILRPYFCVDNSIYRCPFLIEIMTYLEDCDNSKTSSEISGLYRLERNKYMGLKIRMQGRYHYGWINFSKKTGVDFVLRAYAYNTVPEEAIVIEDPFYTPVESKQGSGISFYPNPAGDFLKIEHAGNEGMVKVRDLTGRTYFSQEIYSSPATIPIGSLAKGVYVLQVVNARGRFIEKFVKE